MSLRHSLLKAARGSVLMKVGYLALTLAGSVVLARALGPEGYGTYAFVLALVTVIAVPAQAGVPALLVRETAKAHACGDWATMKGVWRWATRFILSTSAAVVAIAVVVVWTVADDVDPVTLSTLYAGLLLLPLIALGDARGAALRGLRHIVLGQLPESLIRPAILLLMVGVAWWVTGGVGAAEAMAWHVVAAVVAFLVGGAILWRSRPAETIGVIPDKSAKPQWRRAILPLALITSVQMVSAQAGVLLLGFIRPDAEVGVYKVAASAAALAAFGLQIANVVVQPHIARLHATGDIALLQRLARIGALASTALTLPVFLVFVFAGEALLGLLYGDLYRGAWLPLVILAFGQMVNAAFGSVGLLLSMTGHERDSVRWLSAAAGFNIVASIILIPVMGTVGAAVSYASSIVLWNVAFRRAAILRIGVDGSILSFLRPSRI